MLFLEAALAAAQLLALEVDLASVVGGMAAFFLVLKKKRCRTSMTAWPLIWTKCDPWRMPIRSWNVKSESGMRKMVLEPLFRDLGTTTVNITQ